MVEADQVPGGTCATPGISAQGAGEPSCAWGGGPSADSGGRMVPAVRRVHGLLCLGAVTAGLLLASACSRGTASNEACRVLPATVLGLTPHDVVPAQPDPSLPGMHACAFGIGAIQGEVWYLATGGAARYRLDVSGATHPHDFVGPGVIGVTDAPPGGPYQAADVLAGDLSLRIVLRNPTGSLPSGAAQSMAIAASQRLPRRSERTEPSSPSAAGSTSSTTTSSATTETNP